jgi:parallel beta-helix repeat protein
MVYDDIMKKKILFSFILVFIIVLSAFAGCIYDEEKTQCILLNNEKEFSLLTDAINASKDGDELLLCKGSYYGGVNVNTSITIRGNNPEDTIIYPSKNRNTVIMINAKDCNINSLTITIDNTSDSSRFIKGIELNENSCNISNMIIRNCTYGIYCKEEAEENTIWNNFLVGNQNGMEFYESHNNIIEKNTIKKNSQFGILFFEKSESNIVQKNKFVENKEAIRLKGFDVSENRITNNVFTKNEENIHECCGTHDNIIFDNDIE